MKENCEGLSRKKCKPGIADCTAGHALNHTPGGTPTPLVLEDKPVPSVDPHASTARESAAQRRSRGAIQLLGMVIETALERCPIPPPNHST